jgi:hypothetical protein
MFLWRQGTDLKRRAEWLASQSFVVLAMQIPKNNDKGANSIEQFFAAVHGIYRNDPVIQEYLSFEIVAQKELLNRVGTLVIVLRNLHGEHDKAL